MFLAPQDEPLPIVITETTVEEIETVETTTTISEIEGPYLDIQTTEDIPYDLEETAQRIVEQVVRDVTTELRQGPVFVREVTPVIETTVTEEVRLECQVTGIPQPTINVSKLICFCCVCNIMHCISERFFFTTDVLPSIV